LHGIRLLPTRELEKKAEDSPLFAAGSRLVELSRSMLTVHQASKG